MINVQEILEKHCAPIVYHTGNAVSKDVKAAIKEICTELLEKAADNSKCYSVGGFAFVDKQSITNTINEIEGL